MNPSDFLGISVIGIGLSLLMSVIKDTFGTKSNTTKLLLVIISMILGTGYYFLQLNEGLYQIVIMILSIASAFYAFFLKK